MSKIFGTILERIEVLQIKHDISKMECEMQYHQGMTQLFEDNLCQLQTILGRKLKKFHTKEREESI